MASFSIRAARPEDCPDLLRLIKVRVRGGPGGRGAALPLPEQNNLLRKGRGGERPLTSSFSSRNWPSTRIWRTKWC